MIFAVLNISSDVGVTALVALAVAGFTGWLTATTTNRRQDKQLEHDRRQTERADLLEVLEDAAAAAGEATSKANRASSAIERQNFEEAAPYEGGVERAESQALTAVIEASTAIGELIWHRARLEIRLDPDEEPAVQTFDAFLDAAEVLMGLLPEDVPVTDDDAARFLAACEDASHRRGDFLRAARGVVGATAATSVGGAEGRLTGVHRS